MKFFKTDLSLLITLLTISLQCLAQTVYNPTVPLDFSIGTDGPQHSTTLGSLSQHFAIFVQDYNRALAFYRDMLGMRVVFEAKWDTYKIAYLAFTSGGGPGAAHQTGTEMYNNLPMLRGAIEIQWYTGIQHLAPIPGRGISHYGLTVPDMAAVTARLQANGATFLKWPGQPPNDSLGVYYGFPTGIFPTWFKALIPLSYAFILDPEGYVLELSPQ